MPFSAKPVHCAAADGAEASSGQGHNPVGPITYNYDPSSGRLLSKSDSSSGAGDTFTYDSLGRQQTITETLSGAPTVVLTPHYTGGSALRTGLKTSIAGTADYQFGYEYDSQGNLVTLISSGQTGGIPVAAKEVDFGYNTNGTLAIINRLEGTQSVADSTYAYDYSTKLGGTGANSASFASISKQQRHG